MELKLPEAVISKIDVARLMRELNSLDDFLVQASIRPPGTSTQPPRLTRSLELVAKDNKYNLLDKDHRRQLQAQLNLIMGQSPQVHISFAAEPSIAALNRIVGWFRSNIHPQTLLQVGLQPTIGAGCLVRTPNLMFDISLRAYLKQEEPYLVKLIQGAGGE